MKSGSLLTRLTIYVTLGSIFSIAITLIVLYIVLHITDVPSDRIPKTMLYSTGVLVLAFMLPIFFVRAFLYKLIVEKIEKMIDNMDRVSRGDLDTPVRPETNDEFGKMAEAFEKMRVNIRDLIRELEEHIDKRK
ncbi:MAG: HAMP domain-containing protein [Aquificae bacterium]|nr:HAMP domain-containing protein [Aquificota bacterium]